MHLSVIHLYPIKSAAALAPEAAVVEPRGLAHDRRWMIVDTDGRFLTGRQLPRLVLLRASPIVAGLRLEVPGGSVFEVQTPATSAPRVSVSIWDSAVVAQDGGDDAAQWLSAWLGREVRLVHMDAAATRAVSSKHGQPGDEVSFADGYPLLAISQAALDNLNTRLAQPVPMLRFRPNLVIAGCAPHAEDGWRRVRIGAVTFDAVKTCVRCVFTTVDPKRGEFDPSGEPLKTLKTYRRSERGITFGMNLIARGGGTVRVGDPVEVLS